MKRLAAVLPLALVAALPTTAAVGRKAHAASVHTVVLKDIALHPATVRIAVGDTVRWSFRDKPSPHTVTSMGKLRFRSTTARQTGTYSVRFAKAGTYHYACTIHPNMRGRVVVG